MPHTTPWFAPLAPSSHTEPKHLTPGSAFSVETPQHPGCWSCSWSQSYKGRAKSSNSSWYPSLRSVAISQIKSSPTGPDPVFLLHFLLFPVPAPLKHKASPQIHSDLSPHASQARLGIPKQIDKKTVDTEKSKSHKAQQKQCPPLPITQI